MDTLDLNSYFASKDSSSDTTPEIRNILSECSRSNIRKIVFPRGIYHFWPEHANEDYIFVSNNDEGLKRFAFPLQGFDGFEIDGSGSDFIFHGLIVPFLIQNSRNIVLRNLSIDWETPFHAEAIVLSSSENSVDMEIGLEYPYRLENGRLVFQGECGQPLQITTVLEFDAEKRETAFLANDNPNMQNRHVAEEIGPRQLRYHARFRQPLPKVGNTLVLKDGHRLCPAIIMDRSQSVHVDSLDIFHAGGMGIIAQKSFDITVERTNVRPRPGGGRMISTTADATHFVECGGNITITDCSFENQMDDPINIHGINARIERILGPNSIEIQMVHRQQYGIDIAAPGQRFEFINNKTLSPVHRNIIERVERINKEYSVLHFAKPIPDSICSGMAVTNLNNAAPHVVIRNVKARGNRARGFLLSTSGEIIVEDCEFHIPGAAILIAGDANFWFESGPVRDVKIRRNRFINCNYGIWGRAVIDINPEIDPKYRPSVLYHRQITIEDNLFVAFDRRLLCAHCVDGLIFRNNRIVGSDDYPAQHVDAETLDFSNCANVIICENCHENFPAIASSHQTLQSLSPLA